MQKGLSVFFALFLLLCYWSMASIAEPIVQLKASFVNEDKYDFVSLIRKKNSPDHICTGSLIVKNLILTSASCIESVPLHNLEAIFIITDPSSPSHLNSDLDSYITYKKWAELNHKPTFISNSDDLAIVTLKREITRIVPAALYLKRSSLKAQKKVRVVGWGQIQGDKFPFKANTGPLKVWNDMDCVRQVNQIAGFDYTKYGLLTRMVCASGKDENRPVIVYDGDYGGPVVDYVDRVIGIMISRCPVPNKCFTKIKEPNLLLNLQAFEKFLSDVMTASLNLPSTVLNSGPS